MSEICAIILPLVAIVFAGLLAGQINSSGSVLHKALIDFCLHFGIPALVRRTRAAPSTGVVLFYAIWAAYLVPAAMCWMTASSIAMAGEHASSSSRQIGLLRADQAERCPGLAVEIVASSAVERGLVCTSAAATFRLLERCNIRLKRQLRVEIVSEVRHPFSGPILGMFDFTRERVLIAQEASVPALVKDTPYAVLPLRAFYNSLVVHEIVHGVMHQNLERKPSTHAAYEYPAYALQLESLPMEVRDAFLRSFDPIALKSDSLFSDPILFFDPYFFAARAYHHYRAAPDACMRLTGLLSGEVAFIAPPM